MSETLVIEAGRTEKRYWQDLWRYKELFYILSWRDIKVRYKQTVVGALWSVIRPLLTMIIFYFLFSRIANVPAGTKAPYPLMVFAGLLPWTFFSNSLAEAGNSLVSNSNLISKVYFPRLIVPTASVITSLVDFFISLLLMFILYVVFGYAPDWHIIFLPLFLVLAFVASMGIGLYITALNVKYRDFRYILPFIVQFGLYVSPVAFNSTVVPEKYHLLFSLNPIVGVIDGFRWSLLKGDQILRADTILISCVVSFLFLWIGIRQFRKMEKSFADII